ncbi:MAG: hypothetical protein ACR2GA_05120 [Chloroflexota bacterium]
MVTEDLGAGTGVPRLPPISEVAVASMILIVCGGIYLAAYLPNAAPLGPALAVLVLAIALLLVNAFNLNRLHEFAWDTFFLVGRWTFLAYLIIAGMLEYIFVVDQTRGGLLVVLTLMLLVYAVDIPVLLAFSVARYQTPDRR